MNIQNLYRFPEESNESVLRAVGNNLANSVIPPNEMARHLSGTFFTIIKDSWQYQDMSEQELNALDATYFILIDCLLRLNKSKVSK